MTDRGVVHNLTSLPTPYGIRRLLAVEHLGDENHELAYLADLDAHGYAPTAQELQA